MSHPFQPPSAFDRHFGAHRSAQPQNHDGLITQLTHSDWKVLSQHPAGSHGGHQITLTDLEKDKHTLADAGASTRQRSKAAGELWKSGCNDVRVTDKNGIKHVYHLEQAQKDGTTETKVTEHNKVVFDVFDDAQGNEIVVPHTNDVQAPRSVASAGGRHWRVPLRRPKGLSYPGTEPGSVGHYHQPRGGESYNPPGHVWQGLKNKDGSVTLNFNGCQVDTDGIGAHRHKEDPCRQSHTSLRLSDGTSLDTDRDNFFVLPPSIAHAYNIHEGDLGWLVNKHGQAVPVVFGDSGPKGKLGEASIAALKSLGYDYVNGAVGVDKDPFKVVFVPGSGDGTGDIARAGSEAMAAKLNALGTASSTAQVS